MGSPAAMHVHEGGHMHGFGHSLPVWPEQKGHPSSPRGVCDLSYAQMWPPCRVQAMVHTDGVLCVPSADGCRQQENLACKSKQGLSQLVHGTKIKLEVLLPNASAKTHSRKIHTHTYIYLQVRRGITCRTVVWEHKNLRCPRIICNYKRTIGPCQGPSLRRSHVVAGLPMPPYRRPVKVHHCHAHIVSASHPGPVSWRPERLPARRAYSNTPPPRVGGSKPDILERNVPQTSYQ